MKNLSEVRPHGNKSSSKHKPLTEALKVDSWSTCGDHIARVPWQVDVCDKVDVNSRDPFLDSSYDSSFVYTLLDGSGEEITFDSTPTKDPTGEVQVRFKGCSQLVALRGLEAQSILQVDVSFYLSPSNSLLERLQLVGHTRRIPLFL